MNRRCLPEGAVKYPATNNVILCRRGKGLMVSWMSRLRTRFCLLTGLFALVSLFKAVPTLPMQERNHLEKHPWLGRSLSHIERVSMNG
jgi:hypothetical protein